MCVRSILAGLGSAVILAGCVAVSDVSQRIELADRVAAQHQFSRVSLLARGFVLAAFMGPQTGSGVLHVYIEGDGFAWATRYRPSVNPTPVNPLALRLAVQDGQDAAYLARPCQYSVTLARDCNTRYWTSHRFSLEVIEAMDDAVTQLKTRTGASRLVLIGYSGGGTVAALVAARRKDVDRLVTVAGNLDHKAWTRLHNISALTGSLNPPDEWRALAGVSQIHFIGQSDRIVPDEVYQSYRRVFPEHVDIRAEYVLHADHGCCWERAWLGLLSMIR